MGCSRTVSILVALVYSVALGYDEGTVLIKIGREEPVASMDSSGKVIWARHNEIQTVNVKSIGEAEVCRFAALFMQSGTTLTSQPRQPRDLRILH